MKVLWTLVKIVLALALLVPLSIIVLATSLGILGALFGLAVFALRLAVIGLVIYGLFRLGVALFGGSRSERPVPPAALSAPVPPRDPHYEAAMRELDQELGPSH